MFNKLTKPLIFNWSKRMANHTRIEKRSRLIFKIASSEEYWNNEQKFDPAILHA